MAIAHTSPLLVGYEIIENKVFWHYYCEYCHYSYTLSTPKDTDSINIK